MPHCILYISHSRWTVLSLY